MSYLDKTFCASTNCKNDCGRRMTVEEHEHLKYLEEVSYGYFCGEPENAFWKNPEYCIKVLASNTHIE